MKKLISIFAALALVGSLAAQKKKPAAKVRTPGRFPYTCFPSMHIRPL
jgi:hypothetical protein